MHTGPNIVNDGLVFGYDTGYGVADNNTSTRYYRGKVTTNKVSELLDPTFNSLSNGDSTYANAQLGSGFIREVVDFQGRKALKVNRGSSNGSYSQNRIYWTRPLVVGNYYSWSAWVYSNVPGPRLSIEFNGGDYSWGVSQTNYGSHTGSGWERLTVRINSPTTSNTNSYNFIYVNTNSTFYVRDIQMEYNQYPTPFTVSPRTTTTSLIDLTKTTDIDVSNVSFDSTGQPTFDGTDDDIDLGSDITFKTSGGWSVESVVKYNSVAGSYNNVTSPANFIGSDSISYNSWYWSVLSGKLALWNISPGVWKYGSTILQQDTWYHVTIVSSNDGTSYQMYLNGVAEGGDHTTYNWNPSYSGLKIRYIGRGNTSNRRLVNGNIPITKVYDGVLTPEEVKQNYNSYKNRFDI